MLKAEMAGNETSGSFLICMNYQGQLSNGMSLLLKSQLSLIVYGVFVNFLLVRSFPFLFHICHADFLLSDLPVGHQSQSPSSCCDCDNSGTVLCHIGLLYGMSESYFFPHILPTKLDDYLSASLNGLLQ